MPPEGGRYIVLPILSSHTESLALPTHLICFARFCAVHVHTFARGSTRTRARPERGRRAEHERDGRDRPVHRDTACDSGDGRAAMPAGVGGGGGALSSRRARLGGTRRGHAARGRHVRVSPRDLRAGTRRTADVVSLHLADAYSGAACGGLGRNWFFAIPHVSRSARKISAES